MNFFRAITIVLTQCPIVLFVGGTYDLLGGFNQTDAGFGLLIGLFLVVPIINLIWLGVETGKSFKKTRAVGFNKSIVLPFVALLFFLKRSPSTSTC